MQVRIVCVGWFASLVACGGERGDSTAGQSGTDDSGSASIASIDDGSATSPETGASAEGTDVGESADSGDGSDGSGAKFDVGGMPDAGAAGCEQTCGETGFSYIFIANSGISMMSKINTETLEEEGRYLTREGAGGDPSRTSVSIDGRMGSINNRQIGGVLTVWTVPELCDASKNGQAGLQTSTGPTDVLAWNEDDCVAWFTDIPGAMRPIAWVAGDYNQTSCQWENQKLWTATSSNVMAYRLDGETGVIEDMVPVPALTFGYGGASDADGNFWLIDLGVNLARIDADDLSVSNWQIPNGQSVYGITVASDGRVWMSANMSNTTSAVRFTPGTETFDFATGNVAYAQSGIAEDAMGRMWMNDWNTPYKIYPIDKDTMVTGEPFVVEGSTSSAKGIAVDKNGYVWTAHFDNRAYRMDVDNNITEFVEGLDYPYTYSDMTGGALTGVTCGSPTG
jgi:hypothetical protein